MPTIEILSWNIGNDKSEKNYNNKNRTKINNLLTEAKSKWTNDPDVLIVGFQELPINTKFIAGERNEYYDSISGHIMNNISGYTCLVREQRPYTCFEYKGFFIAMFIFAKKEYEISFPISQCGYYNNRVSAMRVSVRSNIPTKGFCSALINIDGTKYCFFNIHSPFVSSEESERFLQSMSVSLQRMQMSSNIILFGDLNSRSLMTSECFKKDISCGSNNNPTWCNKIKKHLENLSIDETIKLYNVEKSTIPLLWNYDWGENVTNENALTKINEVKSILSTLQLIVRLPFFL